MCPPETDRKDTFLWLSPFAPPTGYTHVPAGGMCLCVFLFVRKGRAVLLGKYKEHPTWEKIAGMDAGRVRANRHGFTLPASHLKFGEDPLQAARRVCQEILLLPKGLTYSEPLAQTFFYETPHAPGEMHYDVLFLYKREDRVPFRMVRDICDWPGCFVANFQPPLRDVHSSQSPPVDTFF